MLISLVLGAVALGGCDRAPPEWVLSGPTMGTTYTVRVVAAPVTLDAATLRKAVEDVLARVDRTLSGYRPDSEVARFNAAAVTDWFAVSSELAEVVQAALEVSQHSAGAFDVTVAPLVHAWGFGASPGPAAPPDEATLARLASRVGYSKLHVRNDAPALRKDIAELSVDLNGIAPGFAVDRVAASLRALGVERFLVNIGGEIRTQGRNAHDKPWRIAIEQPIDAPPVPYAFVALETGAITTSGEYRHSVMREGRRDSHTIDPRTARPVAHRLASVVVIGQQAVLVDAWATALNVLGPHEGYELAARHGVAALFIEGDAGRWHSRATPQFQPYLVFR